jgi:hypothetical protein
MRCTEHVYHRLNTRRGRWDKTHGTCFPPGELGVGFGCIVCFFYYDAYVYDVWFSFLYYKIYK